MEQEKRIRREIANSNERRRMQSINAGFQSLRTLLPHHDGEKLSKAAILQQTADFISELENEKSKLLSQNSHLKRLLSSSSAGSSTSTAENGSTSTGNVFASPHSPAVEIPPSIVKRRKTMDGAIESGDEGIGSMSPDHSGSGEESRGDLNELRRETRELRLQLDRERRHRATLEEHITRQEQQLTIYARKVVVDANRPVVRKIEPPCDDLQSLVRAVPISVPAPENPRCVTIRRDCGGLHNIVAAIRHVEGDRMFEERRQRWVSTTSSPLASPAGMENSSSASSPMSQRSPSPLSSHEAAEILMDVKHTQSSPPIFIQESNTTVLKGTSRKHHVFGRLARNSSDGEEQPMTVELHSSPMSPNEFILTNSGIVSQNHSLRPGVIVITPYP